MRSRWNDKIGVVDNRQNSSTFKALMEVFLGDEDYKLVTIPPGVINGYKV